MVPDVFSPSGYHGPTLAVVLAANTGQGNLLILNPFRSNPGAFAVLGDKRLSGYLRSNHLPLPRMRFLVELHPDKDHGRDDDETGVHDALASGNQGNIVETPDTESA